MTKSKFIILLLTWLLLGVGHLSCAPINSLGSSKLVEKSDITVNGNIEFLYINQDVEDKFESLLNRIVFKRPDFIKGKVFFGDRKIGLDLTKFNKEGLLNLIKSNPTLSYNIRIKSKILADTDTMLLLKKLNTKRLSITISDEDFDNDDLQKLIVFKDRVLYLALPESLNDKGLLHLQNLPELHGLCIRSSQVSDNGMEVFKKLKKLNWLNLFCENVSEMGFFYLANLNELTHLSLYISPKTSQDSLGNISTLTSLKTLNIHGMSITDSGMADLAKIYKLALLSG